MLIPASHTVLQGSPTPSQIRLRLAFESGGESRFAAAKVLTASGQMPQRTLYILLQSAVTRCTEAPQCPDAPVDGQEADAAAGCIAMS
jgi:hypothetical protein